jgi:hypothetical protein
VLHLHCVPQGPGRQPAGHVHRQDVHSFKILKEWWGTEAPLARQLRHNLQPGSRVAGLAGMPGWCPSCPAAWIADRSDPWCGGREGPAAATWGGCRPSGAHEVAVQVSLHARGSVKQQGARHARKGGYVYRYGCTLPRCCSSEAAAHAASPNHACNLVNAPGRAYASSAGAGAG